MMTRKIDFVKVCIIIGSLAFWAAVYGVIVFALSGCASPNASIGLALTHIEKSNAAAFADYENALRVLEKSYVESGEKLVAREMDNLITAGKASGTINAAAAEKAFLTYRDNMKAYSERLADFRAQVEAIKQKRIISQRLMDSVKYYHEGKDLQSAIITTITQLASGLEGVSK